MCTGAHTIKESSLARCAECHRSALLYMELSECVTHAILRRVARC